jgi:hypothetical protein
MLFVLHAITAEARMEPENQHDYRSEVVRTETAAVRASPRAVVVKATKDNCELPHRGNSARQKRAPKWS